MSNFSCLAYLLIWQTVNSLVLRATQSVSFGHRRRGIPCRKDGPGCVSLFTKRGGAGFSLAWGRGVAVVVRPETYSWFCQLPDL
jgi:hypothetical protein